MSAIWDKRQAWHLATLQFRNTAMEPDSMTRR